MAQHAHESAKFHVLLQGAAHPRRHRYGQVDQPPALGQAVDNVLRGVPYCADAAVGADGPQAGGAAAGAPVPLEAEGAEVEHPRIAAGGQSAAMHAKRKRLRKRRGEGQPQAAAPVHRNARQRPMAPADHFQVERLAARARPGLQIERQRGGIRGRPAEQQLGGLARPSERLLGHVALHRKPALAEEQAGVRRGDVAGAQRGRAVGRDGERAFPPVDADQVAAAVGELFFDGRAGGDLAHGVMPVDAVHPPVFEAPRGEEGGQFVGEQNVDVGGQHELAARPPDAHVLGDHLVERQRFGVGVAAVQFRGHLDDAHLAGAEIVRPLERLAQAGTVRAADSIPPRSAPRGCRAAAPG